MSGKKIILFELNEVPFKIIDYFCKLNPNSNLVKILAQSTQYETYAEEKSMLTPWRTWPSLHRGVNDERHHLQEFGQDLSEVDKAFPPIWQLLAKQGIKTGVFGSLHSYPMPYDLDNYSFYFPDTFAAGSECFPKKLSVFQEFNLVMAGKSVRNVSTEVPWKSMLKFLASSPFLGLKLGTYSEIGKHLVTERLESWQKTRRRTYQVVLAFDIFMKQLKSTKPAFVTFFTNHVASSMHRFWAACFPEEYKEFHYDQAWVKTYRNEIEFTMSKFDEFLGVLIDFVNRNQDYSLWVTSSMGQEATEAEPWKTQLYLRDEEKFLKKLGLDSNQWEKLPSMFPRFNYFISDENADGFRERLKTLKINGKQVDVFEAENNFFSIGFGQPNLQESATHVEYEGQDISFDDLGLKNEEIEDTSNTNAFHIPNGSLIIYDPKQPITGNGKRIQISTLEVAPTLLKNYNVTIPEYMKNPVQLSN